MGQPPEPLKRLENTFDEFSQSDEGRRHWRARQAAEAERKLYVKGAADPTVVHLSDVQQSANANCFFVAGLAAIVRVHPYPDLFIRQIIRSNGDGTYTVNLYDFAADGSRRDLPVLLDAHDVHAVLAALKWENAIISDDWADSKTRELWPAFVEEAFAKASVRDGNNMDAAMARLTGVPSEGFLLGARPPAADPSWSPPRVSLETLAEHHQKKHAITLATFPKGSPQIQQLAAYDEKRTPYQEDGKAEHLRPGHAYYVTNVDLGSRTVTIQNPWEGKHKDIVIPYDDLDKVFAFGSANPVLVPGAPGYPIRH